MPPPPSISNMLAFKKIIQLKLVIVLQGDVELLKCTISWLWCFIVFYTLLVAWLNLTMI